MFYELTKTIGLPSATYHILEKYGCTRGAMWYEKTIGSSETMFTSHLDDVAKTEQPVSHIFWDDRFVKNAHGILGGDDKCGVYIMLRMIDAGVPGHYVFFDSEESGCLGSLEMRHTYKGNHARCISLDRKGYADIITSQMGQVCCSNEFVSALSKEFARHSIYMQGASGVFTDSSSFMDVIPECTNLSVGYFKQHTSAEYVDLWFLEDMARACIEIDWEKLPTVRRPQEIWRYEPSFGRGYFFRDDRSKKEYLKAKYHFVKDGDTIEGISFTVDEAMCDVYWCQECGEFNWDGVCACDRDWLIDDEGLDWGRDRWRGI